MNRFGKILEIGYLIFAVLFIYEAITSWSAKSITLLIIAALAIFMFFFRRKMRLKREKHIEQNKK